MPQKLTYRVYFLCKAHGSLFVVKSSKQHFRTVPEGHWQQQNQQQKQNTWDYVDLKKDTFFIAEEAEEGRAAVPP